MEIFSLAICTYIAVAEISVRKVFYTGFTNTIFIFKGKKDIGPITFSVITFITRNMRILFHKAHLYKSIHFIFTLKKAYTANQNCVQLFHMWKYNQSTIS